MVAIQKEFEAAKRYCKNKVAKNFKLRQPYYILCIIKNTIYW